MIISISGCVGTGKTSIADELARRMGCEVVHLNDIAMKYKINDVPELQTSDFDLDKLLDEVEQRIGESRGNQKDLIIEGHYAHFINPSFIDYMFILNRDQENLKNVYHERGYNEKKIEDNIEAENFNICYNEAVDEGYCSMGNGEGDDFDCNGVGRLISVKAEGDISSTASKVESFIKR